VPPLQSAPVGRKQRGDYPTPHWLVDRVVAEAVSEARPGRTLIVDPACGDGRFLVAGAQRVRQLGGWPIVFGCDIDRHAVDRARRAVGDDGTIAHVDALQHDWTDLAGRADVVVGNPPYLSQLAAATTRGGTSGHGGGPYADAAVEFLALSGRLARNDGGRIGLVLPQSILASRDAAPVRVELERAGRIVWSWWSPAPVFDAQVLVCALVIEMAAAPQPASARRWTDVVTGALRLPLLPPVVGAGMLGQRGRLTANFRDQYYGLVPAVVEDGAGPRLVTSGLVDPATSWWGERAMTFARRRFQRPTVDLDRLAPAMRRWADAMLVPKVVVANQTRVLEAVVDEAGDWLPGVPALTVRPADGVDPWAIAAVLTSPVASRWAWHHAAGTGLSARTVRLGPRWLADLPWPAGPLDGAVAALRAGDVVGCGACVDAAYGLDAITTPDAAALAAWWRGELPSAGRVPATSSQPP
jgi:N-6 DNA Methylase